MNKNLDTLRAGMGGNKKVSLRVGGNRMSAYPSGGRWTLCWYAGRKRQRKIGSAEAVLAEAEAVLASWEKGAAAVANLGESKLAEYIRTDLELPGVSLDTLVGFWKKHNPQGTPAASVKNLADEHMAAVEGLGRRRSHVRTLRVHYKRFNGTFGAAPISLVTTSDIDRYLSKNFENLKTRLNHRCSIINLFNFAKRKGHLPYDKPTAADLTERPSVVSKEPEVYTPGEIAAILPQCSDRLKPFVLLGAFAGLRSTEILRLKWKDVQEDVITVGQDVSKTRRRRNAEIPDNLLEWLKPLRGEPDSPVSYTSESHLYESLRAACKSASVPFKENALRHSFVSYHAELHGDLHRTSKTCGHSVSILETVYLKLVSKAEAAKWFSIVPQPTRKGSHAKPTRPQQNTSRLPRMAGCREGDPGLREENEDVCVTSSDHRYPPLHLVA